MQIRFGFLDQVTESTLHFQKSPNRTEVCYYITCTRHSQVNCSIISLEPNFGLYIIRLMFMYNRKRKGPSTDPWGNPEMTGTLFEDWDWPIRKDFLNPLHIYYFQLCCNLEVYKAKQLEVIYLIKLLPQEYFSQKPCSSSSSSDFLLTCRKRGNINISSSPSR